MNNLFDQSDVSQILERIEQLTPDSQRQWGKMNVAQMLAHCNISIETAMGKNIIKPIFIGRIIGSFLKPRVLSEKPFGKNSPTDKSYIFKGDLKFEEEKSTTIATIKSFLKEVLLNALFILTHFLENLHLKNGRSSNGNTWTII